jgi:hypothetical protein
MQRLNAFTVWNVPRTPRVSTMSRSWVDQPFLKHPLPAREGEGVSGLEKKSLALSYVWACSKALTSKGTHSAQSATMPISASAKIGAFASELIATTVPEACMPQV